MRAAKFALSTLVSLTLSACVSSQAANEPSGFDRLDAARLGQAYKPALPAAGTPGTTASATVYGQSTGRIPSSFPHYSYTGKVRPDISERSAAMKATRVNNGFGRQPKREVLLAGHKMQTQFVTVGQHLFFVADADTLGAFLFGVGGGSKEALKTIMADTARLTGCETHHGIYSENAVMFVVPVRCY